MPCLKFEACTYDKCKQIDGNITMFLKKFAIAELSEILTFL